MTGLLEEYERYERKGALAGELYERHVTISEQVCVLSTKASLNGLQTTLACPINVRKERDQERHPQV